MERAFAIQAPLSTGCRMMVTFFIVCSLLTIATTTTAAAATAVVPSVSPSMEEGVSGAGGLCQCGFGIVTNGGGGVVTLRRSSTDVDSEVVAVVRRGSKRMQEASRTSSSNDSDSIWWSPSCECSCPGEYLLPHCLYRVGELGVPIALWVAVAANSLFTYSHDLLLLSLCESTFELNLLETEREVTTSEVITQDCRDKVLPNLQFQYLQPVSIASSHSTSRDEVVQPPGVGTALKVVITGPGWFAQQLHLALQKVNAATTSDSNSSSDWCLAASEEGSDCVLEVRDVVDISPAPVASLPYRTQWMRFYSASRLPSTQSMGFLHFEWLALAAAVVMALIVVERRMLFNTSEHVERVGGGGSHRHGAHAYQRLDGPSSVR